VALSHYVGSTTEPPDFFTGPKKLRTRPLSGTGWLCQPWQNFCSPLHVYHAKTWQLCIRRCQLESSI